MLLYVMLSVGATQYKTSYFWFIRLLQYLKKRMLFFKEKKFAYLIRPKDLSKNPSRL